MKFTAIATTTLAAVSLAQAAVTIVTPWANTTWTAGEHGAISWKATAPDATQKCEIQLLNGNTTNANLVAYVTDPKLPVDCSAGSFDIYPLNDFAAGKYSIRIGQSATSNWAYSGVFNFVGKGAAKPLQVASGASAAPAASSGASAANSTASAASPSASGKTNSTGTASGSSSSPSSGASASTLSMMTVAAAAGLSALAMAL